MNHASVLRLRCPAYLIDGECPGLASRFCGLQHNLDGPMPPEPCKCKRKNDHGGGANQAKRGRGGRGGQDNRGGRRGGR